MQGDFVEFPAWSNCTPTILRATIRHARKCAGNPIASVLAHDAQVATGGHHNCFSDALRIRARSPRARCGRTTCACCGDAIRDGVEADRLRADHFIHLRCEVSRAGLHGVPFALFDSDDRVKLASLMDHAPGQRQFARLEAYQIYYMGKLQDVGGTSSAPSAKNASRVRRRIRCRTARPWLAACAGKGISSWPAMTTPRSDHVAEAVAQGVRVAEFPTTTTAARASKKGGHGGSDGCAKSGARWDRIRAMCRRAISPKPAHSDILFVGLYSPSV